VRRLLFAALVQPRDHAPVRMSNEHVRTRRADGSKQSPKPFDHMTRLDDSNPPRTRSSARPVVRIDAGQCGIAWHYLSPRIDPIACTRLEDHKRRVTRSRTAATDVDIFASDERHSIHYCVRDSAGERRQDQHRDNHGQKYTVSVRAPPRSHTAVATLVRGIMVSGPTSRSVQGD
jgi:hypothetical protein